MDNALQKEIRNVPGRKYSVCMPLISLHDCVHRFFFSSLHEKIESFHLISVAHGPLRAFRWGNPIKWTKLLFSKNSLEVLLSYLAKVSPPIFFFFLSKKHQYGPRHRVLCIIVYCPSIERQSACMFSAVELVLRWGSLYFFSMPAQYLLAPHQGILEQFLPLSES